jgi:hypothetical protein
VKIHTGDFTPVTSNTPRDRSSKSVGGTATPRMGEAGWVPDHIDEWRADFRRTTPGERVAEAIAISRTATKIAAAAERQRER